MVHWIQTVGVLQKWVHGVYKRYVFSLHFRILVFHKYINVRLLDQTAKRYFNESVNNLRVEAGSCNSYNTLSPRVVADRGGTVGTQCKESNERIDL